MTLPTSGAISLNDIHQEVGGSSGSQVSCNDADVRTFVSHVGCSGTTHNTNSGTDPVLLSNFYGLWPSSTYSYTHTTVSTAGNTTSFNFVYYTHTVPSDVTHMSMIAIGAGGGSGGSGSNYASGGGHGGGTFWMKGLEVTPGDSFLVMVGCPGFGGASYSATGGRGGYACLYNGSGGTITSYVCGATSGYGGITRSGNSNGSYSGTPGNPFFTYANFQTMFGDARPIAVNGSRGGYGGPAWYNWRGGGGGGAGGWPNSNNVTPSSATSGTVSFTTHYGGGNGRTGNDNSQYVNSYAASRTSGLDYGGAGGQGSSSYCTGGGGTGYDGRVGASTPTGYGDKGASGGSTDGGSGNSNSYGGTYGAGGGGDDDDYSGAGSRGGYALVKFYYHNVNNTWLSIL